MASVILDTLHSREDLLRLNKAQTAQLCAELRETLIQTVSQTGGHLSSNLGAVELTVALHRVFDTSRDRLVFDVGHQCYVHKLLTGRAAAFPTLRQFGGLGGFPNPAESIHDAAIAGHASNSVSVALGMARARTLRGEDYSVIAVLGDGALTGGLAYEGLCDAGASREPLIIVLNDNKMSIARNVGAIARHLTRMRMRPGYYRFKKAYRTFTAMAPGGKKLYSITHRIKQWMRNALLGANFFEEMGFTYLGPVDGHDVGRVSELLRVARDEARPVVLHVLTVKGKGYEPAERTPSLFHGVGGFNPDSGEVPQGKAGFSGQFGHALCQLAAEDHRVCAITAAMQTGTGLDDFAAQYPTRFFDVGIAEGHAVAMAAGLAAQGMRPVVAIYSTFLQRAYDMLIHDVAISRQHCSPGGGPGRTGGGRRTDASRRLRRGLSAADSGDAGALSGDLCRAAADAAAGADADGGPGGPAISPRRGDSAAGAAAGRAAGDYPHRLQRHDGASTGGRGAAAPRGNRRQPPASDRHCAAGLDVHRPGSVLRGAAGGGGLRARGQRGREHRGPLCRDGLPGGSLQHGGRFRPAGKSRSTVRAVGTGRVRPGAACQRGVGRWQKSGWMSC